MSAEIVVQVVWARAARECLQAEVRLTDGASVAAALAATGWDGLEAAGQGDAAFASQGLSAAVWNRNRPLGHALRDGDRVEVLRDLQIDPMTARRVRYEAAGGIDALRSRGYAGRKQR